MAVVLILGFFFMLLLVSMVNVGASVTVIVGAVLLGLFCLVTMLALVRSEEGDGSRQ